MLSVDQEDFLSDGLQRRWALELAIFETSVTDDIAPDNKATEDMFFVDQPPTSIVDKAEVIFCK